MPRKSSLTIADVGAETSTVSFAHGEITVGSIGGFLTDWGALKTAVEGVIIGVLKSESVKLDDTVLSQALPTNPFAQRELKLKVNYVGDSGGDPTYITIACPDLDALTLVGRNEVLLADAGPMAALVAAMEQIMRYPGTDTETITVTSASIVGRNT
jgi:hypothetical protein